MGLFDIHAHLTDARLAAMEDEVLARAEAAGVTTIVSNGLHPEDNRAVLDLAARSPLVKAAIGLYPVDAVLPEMEAMGVEYPRTSAHTPTATWSARRASSTAASTEDSTSSGVADRLVEAVSSTTTEPSTSPPASRACTNRNASDGTVSRPRVYTPASTSAVATIWPLAVTAWTDTVAAIVPTPAKRACWPLASVTRPSIVIA
ncbi:MAG: TatD family hydrolase [Myxococcales bacterium]|nr:TatD family hydrolase [Myxococcales bacterium]